MQIYNFLKKMILVGGVSFALSLGSLAQAATIAGIPIPTASATSGIDAADASPLKSTNDYLDNIEDYLKIVAEGQSGDYLQQIANNTYKTLQAVNNIPVYLLFITQMAMSWLALDNGDGSPIMASQQNFAGLGYWFTQEGMVQKALQLDVAADLFQINKNLFQTKGAVTAAIPNANDLSYATVLGMPPVIDAGGDSYNYMKYAAALNHVHPFPNAGWQGLEENKKKYAEFYNTIMAISSYNGYVLSSMVADNKNNSAISSLQNTLTTQASSSSWIAQIATEELGKVLREILLYQSQSYVLFTQLLKAQKEMGATLAMTNSLLIVLSKPTTEDRYLADAMNPPPTA